MRALRAILLASVVVAAIAESEDDCINVEEPGIPGGDHQCFKGDSLGMVCGWDGTPDEAYCEYSKDKLKVCAKRRGGGRCKEGNRTPETDKTDDAEPEGGGGEEDEEGDDYSGQEEDEDG